MNMKTNPKIQRRRSIRLRGYDYTQPGAYFVTICAHGHDWLFGKISQTEMILNKFGEIVQEEWFKSSQIRHEIEMDQFVVMPNHIHGIVVITEMDRDVTGRGARPCAPTGVAVRKPKSLGAFIAGFKSAATKRINEWRNTPDQPVWQRNYYEHIIRNDGSLKRIQEYIITNPMRWQFDRDNLNAQTDALKKNSGNILESNQHGKVKRTT